MLGSVKGQSYQNFELLLVDDGSKDGTLEELESYASSSSRIHAFHEENAGPSAARKLGVENAQGDYLAFLDSDDFWEPDFLEKMVGAAQRNQADVVDCLFYVEKAGKSKKYPFSHKERVLDSHEAIKMLLQDTSMRSFLWTKLFAKRLFLPPNAPLFLPEKHDFEDLPLCFSLFLGAERIATISDFLYHYEEGEADSLTSRKNPSRAKEHWESFALLRAYADQKGDEELSKIVRSSYLRMRASLHYDLSLSKKDGLSPKEAKSLKKEFPLFKAKSPLPRKGKSYSRFLEQTLPPQPENAVDSR